MYYMKKKVFTSLYPSLPTGCWHVPAFYVLFLIAIAACKNLSRQDTVLPRADENAVTLNEAQFKNAGVQTGQFETMNLGAVVKVNGKVDVPPQNMVSVSAPLGGYLSTTHLLPGMQVAKGQVIATMQDQQYIQLQQGYLSAKAKLQYAEQDYARQKELNQSQASSDKTMQQALAEANTQRILMNSLAAQLRLINVDPARLSDHSISGIINIYSPISGFVSKVNVNIGKYVNPSEVLFDLINPSDIHLNLKVFERDLPKLFIGQQLQAYSNINPDKKYFCKIILINKDVSPEGTTEVHCHFQKYDPALVPGIYMNAEIQLAPKNVNVLPDDAVVSFEGRQYLFEETGNKKFEMKEVSIGEAKDGFTSILNAQDFMGKNIVVKGAYALLMKLKNVED